MCRWPAAALPRPAAAGSSATGPDYAHRGRGQRMGGIGWQHSLRQHCCMGTHWWPCMCVRMGTTCTQSPSSGLPSGHSTPWGCLRCCQRCRRCPGCRRAPCQTPPGRRMHPAELLRPPPALRHPPAVRPSRTGVRRRRGRFPPDAYAELVEAWSCVSHHVLLRRLCLKYADGERQQVAPGCAGRG